ncbi:MAG: endonuclease III [Candidatus Bathyarchaeota archaeon]|nr:MAG: endonuclease III [Candidatus Bathyarchaeota archaeon]
MSMLSNGLEGANLTAKNTPKEILRILRSSFSPSSWMSLTKDPFRILVKTVLSQATTDRNAAAAFRKLSARFRITPKSLAKADVREIEKAIVIAGLHRNKSRAIKDISRKVLEQFDGSMGFIYSTQFEEARKALLDLPGVGPKTADVVLLFCTDTPTIPIDTHVKRVSKRLGLVPPNASYETIRRALQSLYTPKDYLSVHLMLISLGREYCRARKLLCIRCPLSKLCPSRQMED